MKALRRVILGCLLLAALAVALWQVAGRALTERLEAFAQEWLSRELRVRVAVENLEVSLIPPQVAVEGFDIGEAAQALHVGRGSVRLLPYSSLVQLRPVFAASADDVSVDLLAFRALQEDQGEPDSSVFRPPPFRLRDLRVTNAKLRLPYAEDALEIDVTSLRGSAGARVVPRFLSAAAEMAEIVIRRGNRDLRIERLQVDVAETLRGLVVRQLDVQSRDLVVTAWMKKGKLSPQHEVHAELAMDRLDLLADDLAGLKGRVVCDARLEGSLLDPDLEGTLAAWDILFHGQALGDAQADLRKRGATIDVTSLRGQSFGGAVTGSGRIALSQQLAFTGKAEWKGVAVGSAAAVFGMRLPGLSLADGELEVDGTVEPLTLNGRADGTLDLGKPAMPADWQITTSYEGTIAHGTVTVGQGQINRLEAEATVGPEEQLAGVLNVVVTDTAALTGAGVEAGVPAVTGRLSAKGRLSGTLGEPIFAGAVAGEKLQGLGIAVDRIDGQLTAGAQALQVDHLDLRLGEGSIELAGTIALTSQRDNDFTVHVSQLDAETLSDAVLAFTGTEIPVAEGLLSLRVSVRDPWARVALLGDLTLRDFRADGEAFESLALQAKVHWPEWDGSLHLIRSASEELTLSGSGSGWREMALTLETSEWQLEGWRNTFLQPVKGAVSVSAALRGSPPALSGHVEITGRRLAWDDHILGDVDLGAQADRGRWKVDGTLLDGGVQLDAEVQSLADLPAVVRLSWQDARFTPLVGSELHIDVTSSGSVGVEGRLLRPRELKGQMRIGTLVLAGQRYQLTASEPILARLVESELQIESMRLQGERTEAEVTGGVSLDGLVDLRVRGQADLRLAEDLVEGVRSARGRLSLDVNVDRGASGEFGLSGYASLDKVLLDVGLPIVFTDTQARIAFSDGEIHIEALEGRAGGGRFRVTGKVDPAKGPTIAWSLTEMSPGFVDWLEHEISGDGTVEGTWRDLTVAGEVQVLRVLYDKRVRLVDLIPWFKRRVARPAGGERSDTIVRLDLHVVAPGQIFIDNNFAKVELRADLRLQGPIEKLRLDGPVEVVSGEVVFQDRVFEITSGVVEFDPRLGLEATLHVDAETTVKTPDATYTVYGQLLGTTADYRVVLSSDDPSLSQADLASLVTLGRTTVQMQEGGGGISVNDLLVLGAGGFKEDVEEGVRETFLVDRFEIEPTFSQTTGAFEPRISVGKNLTEDLTALVSTTVGAETQYRGELEYQLTRRISLLGSWESETEDQAGAFGGLVKFKYAFRRLPRFGLLGRGDESGADAR